MQAGDLVKFKKSGKVVVYLGLVNNAMHRFYDTKYGIIEFWASRFDINKKMETVSASR